MSDSGYEWPSEKSQMPARVLTMAIVDRERAALLYEIQWEIERAKVHTEKFRSLHEAYAVMLEEMDEVWNITRMKRRDRDPHEIRKEMIQIAAMAIKAIDSMENFVGGSV